MNIHAERRGQGRFLVNCAAMVVIVAGLNAAKPIIVPFLTAVFLAVICFPFLAWLQTKRVPKVIALVIVFAGLVVLGGLVALFVGSSVNDFSDRLPSYQARIQEQIQSVKTWCSQRGINISDELIVEQIQPQRATDLIASLLGGISAMVSNALMILLIVVFLLLEMATIPDKLSAAYGESHSSLTVVQRITEDARRYMALKTLASFLTGTLVVALLVPLGVDYPLLWGLLAFLLNYVPAIGGFIAAAPAVLLAILEFDFARGVYVALGYVAINAVMGSLVEPRLMGRGLGLSTLVVFMSLVFWGWLLGPIGMILSVPLTMTIKIALENIDETRHIAILLDSEAKDYVKTGTQQHGQGQ